MSIDDVKDGSGYELQWADAGFFQRARALLRLCRPKQWTKNLLVFAAYLFTRNLLSPSHFIPVTEAFLAMCALSSSTYIVNDFFDRERDKNHETKRLRPMASGAVLPQAGLLLAVVLAAVAIAIAFSQNFLAAAILAVYAATQVAYNLALKHIAIADVFTLAFGFVLRAALGAAAIKVGMSGWLFFCTAALSLMLGFAKRRSEFIRQGGEAEASRKGLAGYNRQSLDVFVSMFAGIACVCYGLYCLDSSTGLHNPGLVLTAPFVFFGVCRYLLIVFKSDGGEEPADVLLGDTAILISVVGFVATAIGALALSHVPIIER